MSKTIQSKGELWLTETQFNNRDSAGTLEEGVTYHIIDPVGYATAKYVDDKVSAKTSSTVTISDKTLTTIRATSSSIHFNSSNWVELTIARNGDNYSCWGMAQDTATTCNQYIYTVVGNTTNGTVTLDSTAFITETILI